MQLEFPQMSRISCADCKQWIVDVKKGEFTLRGDKRIPRPENIPTPCKDCPKESPENEKFCVLSKDNAELIAMWHTAKARGWQRLPEAFFDSLNEQQISLIARIYEAHQNRQLGRTIAGELVPLMIGASGKKP